MKYFLVFLLFAFSNQLLIAQKNDYEQFKGEKINIRFAVKFLNGSITTYWGQGSPYRTIENRDRTNTTGRLLSKFYFEPNNPSLYIDNKRIAKNKSTRNYEDLENNHFEFEYSFNFQHYDSTHYSIIRYKEIKAGKKEDTKVITAQKKDGNWLIVKSPSLEDIEYVIKTLPYEVFISDIYSMKERDLTALDGDREYLNLIRKIRQEVKPLFYDSGFDARKLAKVLRIIEKDNPSFFVNIDRG